MSPPCCHPRATPPPSPRHTFCDKCRGRAAWLSYPPAAAPPGRSRTRRRPWSARRLRGEGSGETVAPRSGRGGGGSSHNGFPTELGFAGTPKNHHREPCPCRAGYKPGTGPSGTARRGEQHGDRDTSQKVPRGKQQGQGTEGEPWTAAGAQPSWQARSPSLPERPSCPPRALTVVGEARFAQTHDKVHFHLVRSHGFGANGALETWRESREKSPQPGEEEEEEKSPPCVPGSPPGVPRALTRCLHGGTCPTPCPLALRSSCVVATSSGSVGTATRAGAPGGAEGAGHTWPPAAARL